MIWECCNFCIFFPLSSKKQAKILHPSQSYNSWGSFWFSCHNSSCINTPEKKIDFSQMTENFSNISTHSKIYLQKFPAIEHHGFFFIWIHVKHNYLLLREIFYHKTKHHSSMPRKYYHGTAAFWMRPQSNTERHLTIVMDICIYTEFFRAHCSFL